MAKVNGPLFSYAVVRYIIILGLINICGGGGVSYTCVVTYPRP